MDSISQPQCPYYGDCLLNARNFPSEKGQCKLSPNALTILRRYAPGDGVDEPVVWYEGSGITVELRCELRANYGDSALNFEPSHQAPAIA